MAFSVLLSLSQAIETHEITYSLTSYLSMDTFASAK